MADVKRDLAEFIKPKRKQSKVNRNKLHYSQSNRSSWPISNTSSCLNPSQSIYQKTKKSKSVRITSWYPITTPQRTTLPQRSMAVHTRRHSPNQSLWLTRTTRQRRARRRCQGKYFVFHDAINCCCASNRYSSMAPCPMCHLFTVIGLVEHIWHN